MSAAARTYARATLAAAEDDADRVADELDELAAVSRDAPDEWARLLAPGVPTGARRATVEHLLGTAHPAARNLARVLVDNGRLDELPAIAAELRRRVRERNRELDVHVTSAVPLPAELRERIERRLGEATGSTVRLHASVDPTIIGGLVLRHGDTLFDTSLRGRLDQLRLALAGGTPVGTD